MTGKGNIAIIDIGKTNAKAVLVGGNSLGEIDVRTKANGVVSTPPYPHFDADGLWGFILNALRAFQQAYGIAAISVTAHGASGALLDQKGVLAAPLLDYEHTGPDTLAADYDRMRPPFSETGSPRLVGGLNFGAQLYWQFKTLPGLFERTKTILTYPQYWVYRLTGHAVNEVTSLGCHTDLWDPRRQDFSTLVQNLGWRDKFASLRRANEIIGPVLQNVADKTGLSPDTPVYCGIHDSNASLYPYLVSHQPPFSVVSTGTWVVVLSVGGQDKPLDENRDTLINVDARGKKVPSARFMGGREFEIMMQGRTHEYSENHIQRVLETEAMLLPAVEPSSGPFAGRKLHWSVNPTKLSPGEYSVVVSFYLAMMTYTCWTLAGCRGQVFLEGAMAKNEAYKRLLSAATMQSVVSSPGTGTSLGAALLATDNASVAPNQNTQSVNQPEAKMQSYAQKWRRLVA